MWLSRILFLNKLCLVELRHIGNRQFDLLRYHNVRIVIRGCHNGKRINVIDIERIFEVRSLSKTEASVLLDNNHAIVRFRCQFKSKIIIAKYRGSQLMWLSRILFLNKLCLVELRRGWCVVISTICHCNNDRITQNKTRVGGSVQDEFKVAVHVTICRDFEVRGRNK